jgi:hypothetical protein
MKKTIEQTNINELPKKNPGLAKENDTSQITKQMYKW